MISRRSLLKRFAASFAFTVLASTPFVGAKVLDKPAKRIVKTWTGRINSNWNCDDNWSGGIPGYGDTVIIEDGASITDGLDQSGLRLNELVIRGGKVGTDSDYLQISAEKLLVGQKNVERAKLDLGSNPTVCIIGEYDDVYMQRGTLKIGPGTTVASVVNNLAR